MTRLARYAQGRQYLLRLALSGGTVQEHGGLLHGHR